jgi:hypothetical protein
LHRVEMCRGKTARGAGHSYRLRPVLASRSPAAGRTRPVKPGQKPSLLFSQ